MKRYIKKLKPKSLRWQLIISFFLILVMLLMIIEIYQYINMKNYLLRSKTQILQSRLQSMDKRYLEQIQTSEDVNENASKIVQSLMEVNISASVINKDGNVILGSYNKHGIGDHGEPEKRKQNDAKTIGTIPRLSQKAYIKLLNHGGNLENNYGLIKSDDSLQVVIWRKIGSINSPIGLIQLSISANDVREILNRQLSLFIEVSILILAIGGILARTIFNRTLKPLYNMTNTVKQIDVGQLNIRLPEENGQLEIDKLSYSFNNMLQRIENSFREEQIIKEKMRLFVSNASHELRTPLTSIHGFVEVLLRGAAKNEKQLNLALNSILTESERLTKLVNDLLLLTKLDQKVKVEKNIEDISKIIEEIYPQLQVISKERKIELNLQQDLLINTNRDQMKQVVLNLVHNAIQHTDEKSGIITISTGYVKSHSGNLVILKIKDNGTGIQKEHINEIFDRFFRGESHRSREHGGYGLGLSIVKSIVDSSDGKIEVSSEPGEGTIFTIYLNEAGKSLIKNNRRNKIYDGN